MKLNERLINDFKFKNKTYPINLAFDRVLDMQDIHQDKVLLDDDKIDLMLQALNIECEKDIRAELLEYVLYNVITPEDDSEQEYDLLGNPMKKIVEESERTIDFIQDASLIYSAFRQTYGINLFNEYGRLHWYEFTALLEGLPEDTLLYQVRNIRAWKPQKGDSAEYKRKMRKLKEQYKIRGRGANNGGRTIKN